MVSWSGHPSRCVAHSFVGRRTIRQPVESAPASFSLFFCESSELDSSLYRIDWVRQLVSLLDDPQVPVHTAAWNAFDSFVRSVPKDELEPLVVPPPPALSTPPVLLAAQFPDSTFQRALHPTVPIIIAGLTTGSNDQREQAAYAIGDLVSRTSENAIKPFVRSLHGPAHPCCHAGDDIPARCEDRHSQRARRRCSTASPVFVKPFFPQLQRTFVKSAGDAGSASVRSKAAEALGVLMRNQPRVDPVVTEIVTAVRSNEESIAASFVLALTSVLRNGAQNVGEKAAEAAVEVVAEAFTETHGGDYFYLDIQDFFLTFLQRTTVRAVGGLVRSLAFRVELLRPIVE